MASPAGGLYLELTTNLQKFAGEMNLAGGSVDRFGARVSTSIGGAESRFRSLHQAIGGGLASLGRYQALAVGRIAGAFGLTIGGGALIRGVKDAIGSVAELGDTADRVGASAERLQVLRQALLLNGGAAEDADSALEKFNVRVGQLAQTGSGPAADAMKALGLSVRDASGAIRSNDSIFDDAIMRLSGVQNGAQRSALAVDLFGKEVGPKLATLAGQGAQGLADVERNMRSLGSLMSNESVAAAQAIDDKFNEIANTLSQRFKGAVVDAAGALYVLIDSFRAVENQTSLAGLNKELDANTAALDRLEDARDQLAVTAQAQGLPSVPAIMSADLDKQIAELFRVRNQILNRIGELNVASPRPAPPASLPAPTATTSTPPSPRLRPGIAGVIDLRPQLADTTAAVRDVDSAIVDARDSARRFATEFAHGLREGKSIADSLAGAVGALGDRLAGLLIDTGVNSLFSAITGGLFGGGGSGGATFGLNSILGSLYHGGGVVGAGGPTRRLPASLYATAPRFHAGLSSNEFAAVLQKGEHVLTSQMAGRTASTVDGLSRSVGGGSSPMVVNYSPRIDNRGADTTAVARLEEVMRKDRQAFYGNVVGVMKDATKRTGFGR